MDARITSMSHTLPMALMALTRFLGLPQRYGMFLLAFVPVHWYLCVCTSCRRTFIVHGNSVL